MDAFMLVQNSATSLKKVAKSDAEWHKQLSDLQYRVMRKGEMEEEGSGEYVKHAEKGVYRCAACGVALFSSTSKFTADAGWAAFYEPIEASAVRAVGKAEGGKHISIRPMQCVRCECYLGTLVEGEGYAVPTQARYAVNSCAVEFLPVSVVGAAVDMETVRGPLSFYINVWYIYHGWLFICSISLCLFLWHQFFPDSFPEALR